LHNIILRLLLLSVKAGLSSRTEEKREVVFRILATYIRSQQSELITHSICAVSKRGNPAKREG